MGFYWGDGGYFKWYFACRDREKELRKRKQSADHQLPSFPFSPLRLLLLLRLLLVSSALSKRTLCTPEKYNRTLTLFCGTLLGHV